MSAPFLAWLQWVSKLVLQVVPPVAASVISAYLLSTYHLGSKETAPAPSARAEVAPPSPLSIAVIDAEHAHALRPIEPRRIVDTREAEQIIALPPVAAAMRRIRQGREASRETPTVARVSASATEPQPIVAADAAPVPPRESDEAVASADADKPRETRVFGVRIPDAVASAGQTIVSVGVEQPAKLVGAGLDFGRKTIDALASILPEARR
ncbi:MAG: hypothetical protein AB7O60_07725 [Variibacter sp.]